MKLVNIFTFFLLGLHSLSATEEVGDIYLTDEFKHLKTYEDVYNPDISIHFFENNKRADDKLTRIIGLVEAEKETAIQIARSHAEPNWRFTPDTSPLCIELSLLNAMEIELGLVSSSDTLDSYLEKKTISDHFLEQAKEFILQRREAMLTKVQASNLANLVVNATAVDQGILKFLYNDFPQTPIISDDVKQYITKRLSLQKCINLVNAMTEIKPVLLANGWPTQSKFGKKLGYYLFLIIQHVSYDPDLMLYALDELKENAKAEETNPKFYADLYDKVAIYRGQPQKYGTFLVCIDGKYSPLSGIEDYKNLDKYRAEYNLLPYHEQLSMYPKSC